MKKIILCMAVMLLALLPSVAGAQTRQGDRSQWMNELRQYKRTYFAKELDLSKEQEQKFFPLYEAMENETQQIEEEARTMEKRVDNAPDATDTEYEKATEALYDAKVKQAEVERGYMDKYKSILTPRQLFMLKGIERKFNRELMKQHQRLRMGRKSAD